MFTGTVMVGAVRLARQHLEVGEVLRVIERELGAQHLRQVVRLALPVAQVAAHQRVADHLLLDGGRAEAIALAGLHLQAMLALWFGGSTTSSSADQLRVEVPVGGRGALQVALDVLVALVVEGIAGLAAAGACRMRWNSGSVSPGPSTCTSMCSTSTGAPGWMSMRTFQVPCPPGVTLDCDLGLVVAERAQRGLDLALHAVMQALDRVRGEIAPPFL